MFAKTVIDSDAFIEMPLSTQALYFHLSMRADDDGFLNCAQKIMRMIGAAKNDFDVLIAKRFIIQFPDGICVIKHWRIHNYLRKDRYVETVYTDHKNALAVKENGAYSDQPSTALFTGIPDGNQRLTQDRLGKGSDNTEYIDSLNARVNEIAKLYGELCPGKKLDKNDVASIAEKMMTFEIPLVRKAVLLSRTNSARDPVAYMLSLAADWNKRGITTFEEFRRGGGCDA